MFKKTFNTLKKNPVILLGFALPIILSLLAVLPMLFGVTGFMQDVMDASSRGADISDTEIISFMSKYLISFATLMLISLASIFLITPPVLNKIYEVCSGRSESGWYARGLKRSWWKIFVTTIIISAVSSMLGFVIAIVLFIPFVGWLAYFAITISLSVFVILALTSVIAEDDFGNGLSNIFNVGFKYFFKQLGTVALVNLPIYLVTIAFTILGWVKIINLSTMPSDGAAALELFTSFMPILWIFVGAVSLYSIFSSSFAYVYSMHNYLDKKPPTNK